MVCAGNPGETCGDGGRIQVYKDSTWSSPTLAELLAAVQQYSDVVEAVRSTINEYYTVMEDLQNYLSSAPSRKRQLRVVEEFQMRTRKVYTQLQANQENLGMIPIITSYYRMHLPAINQRRMKQTPNM
jgi:hypothetical protein